MDLFPRVESFGSVLTWRNVGKVPCMSACVGARLGREEYLVCPEARGAANAGEFFQRSECEIYGKETELRWCFSWGTTENMQPAKQCPHKEYACCESLEFEASPPERKF